MNRVSPKMRKIAQRLIKREVPGKKSPQSGATDEFDVFQKLQPLLATLVGKGGFQALLSRALTMAQVEVPWLHTIKVKPDGTLSEIPPSLGPDKIFEGKVALLAHLLDLLVAFIGEKLTLRLFHEVRPAASHNDLEFVNGGKKNEKTK